MSSRNHVVLLPTYVGAALAFLAYIAVGAVPGILYGGYMGLAMSGALFGQLAEPTVLVRVITGGGMILGLCASLFFFLVAGAFGGTLLGLPFAKVLRTMSESAAQPTERTESL